MDSLEILQQINVLSSSILSNLKPVTLEEYIDNYYIPFQKNAKKESNFNKILGKLRITLHYEFVNKNITNITKKSNEKVLSR